MTDQQWMMSAGIAAVAGLLYYASLRLYPYTKCRWCDGVGRKRMPGLKRFWGECHACSGRGRKQRLGARLLHYGTPRQSQPRWARKNRR